MIALGSTANSKPSFRRSGTIPRCYSYSYASGVTTGSVSNTGLKTALYFGSSCARAYGMACPCSNTKDPVIVAESAPALGSVFQVAVKDAPMATVTVLILGGSNTSWAGLGLPFDLTGVGAPNCFLNASIISFFPRATDPNGYAAQPLPIPGDPTLDGAVLYLQWLLLDKPANTFGLVTTAGLETTIGK